MHSIGDWSPKHLRRHCQGHQQRPHNRVGKKMLLIMQGFGIQNSESFDAQFAQYGHGKRPFKFQRVFWEFWFLNWWTKDLSNTGNKRDLVVWDLEKRKIQKLRSRSLSGGNCQGTYIRSSLGKSVLNSKRHSNASC